MYINGPRACAKLHMVGALWAQNIANKRKRHFIGSTDCNQHHSAQKWQCREAGVNVSEPLSSHIIEGAAELTKKRWS